MTRTERRIRHGDSGDERAGRNGGETHEYVQSGESGTGKAAMNAMATAVADRVNTHVAADPEQGSRR